MFTSTSNRPESVDGTRNSLDSTRILSECCEHLATCRFQLVHCVYSVHAKFMELREQWIEIQMPSNDGDSQLIEHAICCVSFSYGTSYCAFLGCLVDIRKNVPGQIRIVATFPKQLIVTNLRRTFRVPVIDNSGLETIIRTSKGEEFTVVTRDITEGGIEFESFTGIDAGISIGSKVSVEMKFRGEVVERSAEVRRVLDNRCGVAFDDIRDDHSQIQALQMRGIVLSLQQLWLRSRVK